MSSDKSDAAFTNRALAQLAAVTPSPGFEAALLAAYDGWRAERGRGFGPALAGSVRGFFDMVWPGAPLWAPVGALAVALILGLGLGTMLPAMGERSSGFSLEQTPGFNLLSADTAEDL